jgi:hypothetical protein
VVPLPAGSLLLAAGSLPLAVAAVPEAVMLPQLGVNGVMTLRVYFSKSTFVGRFECGSTTFLLSCSTERRPCVASADLTE